MPIRAPLAPSSPFAQALQQEEQIQAVNNQAAFEQDFIAKQQREQIAIQRQQESAAADAARQQKANLARAKKAGVKINTDADGNEQMATHEDGQPVYEAGFVGTPSMQGGKASAKYRDARGSSYDVPFEAIRSEQDPSGQTFYNFDVSGPDGKKQTMRQPEGTKPLFRVDKATGQRIADFADPATGSTQTAIVGLDPVAANAAAIQKRRDALQLRQNEISGAAEQLRLEQAAADTKFRPVAERFSAAEKAYEDVTKAKTRYEERVGADGKMAVHQIEDTSFGEQAMPLVDAPTIAKARAWMDQKKRVTTEYEAAKAERDPAKTALQTMQERRDQLALEHLSEKRRAEKEIRLMGEAAKKNYPVYEPEWQKRFLSILEDPRVQDNATIADLEDAGDPLAEDVKRVSRPASAAALNAALEAGIVSPDSPLVAFRTTDTKGMMEDAPRAKLVDTVASGLTVGKPATVADSKAAKELAAKSLGMQPDGVEVSGQKPEGHYELSRKGEVFATLDPRNNRLTLLDTPASLQDKGAEIIANASPDGVPVYMVSSQQPFRPGEVRDLIQEGITAVSTTKSDAEAKSALAAVGLDSAGIRQKVMDGKLSVQDGKLLNDKFNDVKQADMSAEGMRAGFGKWMAVNPVLAAKFQKGGAKEKAEVANFYADTVAAQAKSGIVRSNATMAASRQALVKQVGGGEEGSLWKDVTSGIKQAPGFLWNVVMLIPRLADRYVVNPNNNDADTELFVEQTENFVNRLMVEKAPWKKDASPMWQVLGEVEAWADRADSVDDLPDEMADRLAEAAYTSYHGFKNDGIGGANVDTTRDTYNIKRDPVLRKMMQKYLDTGDASAFNSLGQMLKSNQDERNTDIKVNQYIERPRVATPLEIAARASLLNIQLDPAKAAAILALSKEGETVKDRAGVDDILKRAGQIMGLDPEQAEIAMSEITRAEVTDPDSWTGNFRASSVAPASELAAEVLVDSAIGMMTSTVVGAPEALALKAAQVGSKGLRASMGRFVAHNLDNLGARVPTFAKLRTAIGRGRAKMRADVDELAADYAGLGIQKPVFGSVLTAGQKISNAAVATSKAIVAGAPMEGLEESVVAMLSNDPSLENVTDSALMGALGVVGMVPAFAGVQGIRNAFTKRGQVKEWEKYKQGAINEINAFMGKSAPDFKPLTTADFDAMQAFAGRPVHQAAAQEYAKAQLVHKAEQAAFAEASQSGPAVPPPSLLAAQVRLKTAENSLGAFFTDAFMAADALRALPEAERPLYTAAAKAAAGVTDYTEAEAKALMQQSGDNAIAFQQAQVMPGDVAGPPAMRTTGAPEVTTAAPGVYRIPAGVKITLPPALVSMLEAKAPATVGLMGRGAAMPANQTPAGWQGMTKPGGQPSAQPAVPTPAEAQASDELTSQAPAMKALPKVAKKRSKLLATLKGKGVVVRVVNTTAEAEAILGKKVSKGRKGVSQNVNGTPHVVLIGEQSVDAMADTLDHEAIHGLSLAFAAEYPELHAAAMLAVDPASPEFDAALNEFMSREYNGYDKLSQRQKFEEALRAIVEGRWKGRTSAKSKGFKKFLKAFLAYVQGLMDGSQNAALKQIVANIEGALKDAPQQQPATQTPPPPDAAGGVGTRNPAFANLSNEELAQRHATAVRLSKESGRTDNASWGYDADLMAKEIEARKAEKQAPPSAKTGTKITQENGQNFAKKIIGKFRQTYPGIAKFFKESDDLLDNEAAGRSGLITVVDPASEATSPTFLILFSPRLIAADHVGYDETTAIKRLLAQLDEEVRHVAALQAAKDVWIQKAADQFKADQSKTLLRLPFDAWHASILANDPKARFMPWLKSHYTEIWNDHFTPEMKEAVMQARATQGAEEPWALALEGYRMLDQLEKTNSITEAVLQDLAALLKVLGDFLGKVSKAAESQIKKEITAIRRILESYGYENGAVKPDAKKKPAKANSAKKPQESAEKEPESPASYLDRVLDAAIKDGMGELTIPVPEKNQNRDDLQKAIEAIEARGLQASTDGKNLLVRGFRELAQAAKTKEAARPAAETKDGAASLKTTPETAPDAKPGSPASDGAVDGVAPAEAPKAQEAGENAPEAGDKELGEAFSGLFSAPSQTAWQNADPPQDKDRRDKMIKAATALMDAGVNKPEQLAARLEKLAPNGQLRKYSRFFWRLMSSFDSTLAESPDWQAIYAGIDEPAEPITQPPPNESLADVAPISTPEQDAAQEREQLNALPRVARMRAEMAQAFGWEDEQTGWDMARMLERSLQSRTIGYPQRWNNGLNVPMMKMFFREAGIAPVKGWTQKGIKSALEQWRDAAPVAEESSEVAKSGPPSLGTTGKEIWQGWKNLTGTEVMPGEVVVGVDVNNGGVFSWSGDELMRSETNAKAGTALMRPATKAEIEGIHDSIDRGGLQIESRKITGAMGQYPKVDGGKTSKVIHQATGKPLAEWLETDAGKKWLERDEETRRKVAEIGTRADAPPTGLISNEESARLDALSEENMQRFVKLSANQLSQLAIELGVRPMVFQRKGVDQAETLDRTHPDDLKAALDVVTKAKTDTPATAEAKVEEQVQVVAATEGQRDAKEIKKDIASKIEQAIKDLETGQNQAETITFQIPGDGTFQVLNRLYSLEAVLKRVKRINTADNKAPERVKEAKQETNDYALKWGTEASFNTALDQLQEFVSANVEELQKNPDAIIPIERLTRYQDGRSRYTSSQKANTSYQPSLAAAVKAWQATQGSKMPTWAELRDWLGYRARQAGQSAGIEWTPTQEPTPAQEAPESPEMAEPAAPAVEEIAPTQAATRKPRTPKKPTLFERLQAYFVPGAIVDSYGGKDRVIALYPDGGIGQGGWSVEVVSVDKDGKDTPGARVRRHSTLPSEKALQKAWQDRAEAIVRNLTPKEQAGKLNPREREAIDEARMSLASAPAPGSRGSMASESGAAQNAEPSPGGLSEAESRKILSDARRKRTELESHYTSDAHDVWSESDARENLESELDREPSPEEVADYIAESQRRHDDEVKELLWEHGTTINHLVWQQIAEDALTSLGVKRDGYSKKSEASYWYLPGVTAQNGDALSDDYRIRVASHDPVYTQSDTLVQYDLREILDDNHALEAAIESVKDLKKEITKLNPSFESSRAAGGTLASAPARQSQMLEQAAATLRGEGPPLAPGLQSMFNPQARRPATGERGLFDRPKDQLADSIAKAYRAVQMGQSTVMVPIRAVFQRLKAANPALKVEDYLAAIQAADERGDVMLEAANTTAEQQANAPFVVPSQSGPGVRMAWVDRGGNTGDRPPTTHIMPDGYELTGPGMHTLASAPARRAYHGTPHKVDKFSLDKIGTGEGAQAYGWGLYFAEEKQVAEGYQSRIAGAQWVDKAGRSRSALEIGEAVYEQARKDGYSVKDADELRSYWSAYAQNGGMQNTQGIESIRAVVDGQGIKLKRSGNLYTVELIPDEADFLDWDKPLSEQSEKVKAALPILPAKVRIMDFDGIEKPNPKRTGAEIYSALVENSGFDAKAVSDKLAALGIPGIRYLDGGSRGAGDGTRNYVIFDENLVRILEENGKPVAQESLASAPAQNPNKATQAMRDVIEGLPDPHRKVLRDILVNGMSVEDAATTHTLSEAAVINILRRGEAHVRVMMDAKAASPELAVEDGIVKAAYGRPDLARSGDSLMAALDQNRPMPEVVHRAEMEDLAWAMFSGWPTESLAIVKRWMDSGGMMTVPDNLPHGLKVILDEAAARGAAPMLMQVASNHALNEARLNNAPLFEQMRLGLAWRELGIEQGRAFGARQDTFHDPMERHALYIQKMLTMPQDGDLKTLLNNPASRSRILAEMERRAEDMKRRLKAAGYDLDAWFAEQKAVATEAASFMPPAAAPQLKRLPRKVQHGINAWVAGAKLQDAAREAGMTAQELRDAYADFYAAVNQEAIKAASAAKDEMLRSAPAANDFAAQIGLPPPPATADPNARLNDTPKARAYQARRENAALNRPTEVAAAMSEMSAGQSGFIGKMAEYWRMSILSGPQTWVVNASSGLALGMYRNMVQKLGTAGLASIVRATGMADLPNAPALSDIGPVLQHAWDTFVPSLKNAFRSWKHNRRLYDAYAKGNLTLDPGGKDWDFDKSGIVMDGKEVVFKGEKYGPALSRDKWWKPGAIMDVISFRMLLIADEFVRSWFGRIETAAQLRQMARSEPALKKRTEELRAEIKKMLPTAWELRYTNNNGYYAVKPAVVDFIVEEGQNRRVEKRTIMERVEMKEWSAAVPAAKRDSLATNAADLALHGGFDALLTDKATPEQLKARLDRLGKPGSGAWMKGIEAANTITAQSELGTGVRTVDAIDGLADLIQRGKTSKYALVSVPMQFLFPFVATPVNLFKTGITMSPVGGFLALIDAVRSYRSRKAGDLDGARKIMDAARALEEIVNQTVAWGLVLTLSELMEPDDDEEDPKKRLPRFTGTGEWTAMDAGERELAYRTAPPFSFRIGDRWLSYRRLDPIGIALANIADGIDAFKKEPIERALFVVAGRTIEAMEEKTFLAGAADAMNLIRDFKRYGPRWAANIATGFIPNLIRQPVRSADEQFRDKDIPTNAGFWEKLERHIGYSIIPQFGPEKLDLWGRNVEKDTDTFGPLTDTAFRLLSPVGGSVPAPDALDVALYTFNLENPGKGDFGIEAPERRITRTLAGQKIVVDLTDEERANFIRQAGSRAHATVTAQYGGRKLTLEDVDNIREIVRKVYSAHRDAAFVAAVQKRGGVNSILAKTTK